ncbi:hypothetical protein SynPROS91_01356 [Synechococcus sp. PROS-9-1]|nr:hypothetical protein SynPROS91_01356 [Synechococcus sp. PROS-9-1]
MTLLVQHRHDSNLKNSILEKQPIRAQQPAEGVLRTFSKLCARLNA